MHENEILTYEDLSKVLNRSISSLRHDVMLKKLPYVKLGDGKTAQVRFRRSDIDAWLASRVISARERSK